MRGVIRAYRVLKKFPSGSRGGSKSRPAHQFPRESRKPGAAPHFWIGRAISPSDDRATGFCAGLHRVVRCDRRPDVINRRVVRDDDDRAGDAWRRDRRMGDRGVACDSRDAVRSPSAHRRAKNFHRDHARRRHRATHPRGYARRAQTRMNSRLFYLTTRSRCVRRAFSTPFGLREILCAGERVFMRRASVSRARG